MPDDKPAKKNGYVYILTNPAMPGLVKIGSTILTPDERARQLSSSTGVPRPFQVVAFEPFHDELRAERELQSKFVEYRVKSGRREFYEVDVEQVRDALFHLAHVKASNCSSSTPILANLNSPSAARKACWFQYWAQFNALRAEQKLLPVFESAHRTPFHRHYLVTPSKANGNRNIHYEGRIRINSPQVSMRVIFKTADDIKELFDLIARDRDEIEQEIGFSLIWDRDWWRKECHIAIERDDMDPRDVADWDLQHTWLSEIVSGFEKVLRPRIAKLPRPIA
jgi:hypothetical protein